MKKFYFIVFFFLVVLKVQAQTLTVTGTVSGLTANFIGGASNIAVFGFTVNPSAAATLGTVVINHSALTAANLNGTFASGNYRLISNTTSVYGTGTPTTLTASVAVNAYNITFSGLNLSLASGVTRNFFLVVNVNSSFAASFPLKTNFNINSGVTNTFQNNSGVNFATNNYGDIRTYVYPNLARCGGTGTFWYEIPSTSQTEDNRTITGNNPYTNSKITGSVPGYPSGTFNTSYFNDGDRSTNFLVATALDVRNNNSYQAAGIVWSTTKSNIAKVVFHNAKSPISTSDSTTDNSINGYFHNDFKLQYITSGSTTWTNATGWTSSPTYPTNLTGNNSSAYYKTFTLTGPVLPSNVTGIRVMGQLRTASSYSWSLGVREIEVFPESIYFFKPAQTVVSTLANWGVNLDGTGTVPTSFTEPTQFYFNSDETLDASIVSSSSTNFIIGNGTGAGVALTMGTNTISNATVDIPLAIGSGSNTLKLAGSTAPIIGVLSQGTLGSTVEYNGATQTIGNYNYNNLTITNTGDKSMTSNITVNRALTIQSGTAKLAIGSNTLTLNGTFTGSAATSLKLNGSSNLSIGGTGSLGTLFFDQTTPGVSSGTGAITMGTTNRLNNFIVNRTSSGTLTLGNELQITNVLTPTAGTITSNGNLVMLSTDATTSSIGDLTNASIIGNVNIHSFFKGGTDLVNRGFRMISFPVNDVASPNNIFTKMKERFIITGTGNTGNGFDMGGTKQPNAVTIMSYYEPALPTVPVNSYTYLASLSTASVKGQGYYFFFRGNRANVTTTKVNDGTGGNAAGRFPNPEDNIATYIGSLNTGNVDITVTKTNTPSSDPYNGYNLVGNPYASTIDFDLLQSNNVSDIEDLICILNRNRSGYLTRSGGITNAVYTPVSSGSSSTDIRYIQPCQGFFVKAKNNNDVLQFRESQKVTSASPVRLLEVKEKIGIQLNNTKGDVEINQPIEKNRHLVRLNVQDSLNVDPATIVLENGFDKNHTTPDAVYFGGTSTVSCNTLTADGVSCAINFMPPAEEVDSIKLFVNTVASNNELKLNFTDISGVGSKQLTLIDKYLNKKFVVSEENATYNFAIDKAIPASFGNSRFVLVFGEKEVLPVNFVNFSVKKQLGGALILWETAAEININHYVIERSIDGEKFQEIGIHQALGNTEGNRLYSFIDKTPDFGVNYYRIKSINKDNPADNKTTIIKSIDYTLDESDEISVYPNPVKDVLNVVLKDKSNSKAIKTLLIYDLSGKAIKKIESVKTGNFNQPVGDLKSGVYVLYIKDASNKFLGSVKFTKE